MPGMFKKNSRLKEHKKRERKKKSSGGLPIMKKMKESDNADDLGSDFTGPDYNYGDYIKTTDEMGMSGAGNFDALADDIAGLISYSDLLIEGSGNARIGGPLGNRFFTKTGTKCKPSVKKGKKWVPAKEKGNVDRYLYIDNTTKGKNPFGRGSTPFKGLVPGMLENLASLNPMGLMAGFVEGSTPPCVKISRKTGPHDKNGSLKTESHYVSVKDMEGFRAMNDFLNQKQFRPSTHMNLKDKPFANLYNAGFGILLIYLLFEFMKK